MSNRANQQIYCTVNSCYYYDSGDKCATSKIMLRNNPETVDKLRMEIGSIGDEARTSNQTLCHTFIPKAEGP